MRLAMIGGLAALLALASAAAAAPQGKTQPPDLKGKSVKENLLEVLPGLAAAEFKDRQAPQQRWQEICLYAGSPGKDAMRLECCKAMIEQLGPKTDKQARLWLLKQLEQIGRDEAVDAVAAVLADKDGEVRDAAIRALAANPAKDATTKLVADLGTAAPKAKVAVINALAYRADPAAVPAIVKELASEEAPVTLAAAHALGKFATPDAAKALASSRASAKGTVALAIGDAYLQCADRWLADGKAEVAAAIYQELCKDNEPRALRMAGLQGVLKTAGDKAGTLVLEMLAGKDNDARAIATGHIPSLNNAALKTVAGGIDKLSPAGQALVLGALASRGDKSQGAVALAATKSTDETIQRAGVAALGKLGDATAVPVLVEIMFGTTKVAGPAKDSLARITGPGVDEKILEALKAEKKTPQRIKLIEVLEQRKAVAAVAVLLDEALGEDASIRASALSALKQTAEPQHIPKMVAATLKAKKGKERDDAELAIVAVASKVVESEKRAEPVLAIFNAANADKAALLPLLGRLGGPKALDALRNAMAGGTGPLYDAAVIGLCNWPDSSGAEELLKLVKTTQDKNQRAVAFRALVRVNSSLTDGVPATKLATLQKAMEMAASLEERKLVLQGLETVRHIETLRFVMPYLEDKDLNQQACKTIVELAHSKMLREPNRAEFTRALDRVIALSRDKGLVERAKQYKQG